MLEVQELRRNGLRGDVWDLLSLASPASPSPWDWDAQGSTEIPLWDAQGSMEIPLWDVQGSTEIPLWDAQGSTEIPLWDAQGSTEIPLWDVQGSTEIPLWDAQGSPRIEPWAWHGSSVPSSTTSRVQGSMAGRSRRRFSRLSRQVPAVLETPSSSWGSGKVPSESGGQSSTVRMDFCSGNLITHIPGLSKAGTAFPRGRKRRLRALRRLREVCHILGLGVTSWRRKRAQKSAQGPLRSESSPLVALGGAGTRGRGPGRSRRSWKCEDFPGGQRPKSLAN
ncbi:uncharacterized protein LOC115913369 [Camarhynchus parvulus]|uniref:uncharacterized protein LOC115913369 n=1 Tax=Geospiza parvula TaxID=87175 RepID=UPI00123814CE|nr:uncharacterized protein LOC115913369 [Camarhynchus parvulus]